MLRPRTTSRGDALRSVIALSRPSCTFEAPLWCLWGCLLSAQTFDGPNPYGNGPYRNLDWWASLQCVIATCGTGIVYCWSTIDGSKLWTYSQGHHWCRAISVSPDGRFVAIGGEDGGNIGIIDLTADIVDGKRTACMQRRLGDGGVHVKLDPVEEEEEDIEKKQESQKHAQTMVLGMIACRTVRFLPPIASSEASPGSESTLSNIDGDLNYRLGYTNSVDPDVEIYDMVTNRKWRCEPLKPQHSEETVTERRRSLWNQRQEPDSTALIGWDYVPPSEGTKGGRGQVLTIHGDGVRLWDLDV